MAAFGNEARGIGKRILDCFVIVTVLSAFTSPITNNAVAYGDGKDGPALYSFLGLEAGKTHKDVSRKAFACALESRKCRILGDVPVEQGRLASIAVNVGGQILLFGGYTVAPDGGEVSTPDVLAFDPKTESYSSRAPMPTPVDDSVALVYQDRYVYLVSGWHDEGNVNLTQVYDAKDDRWFNATPYPGTPVFGHAGGIVGREMVITDGVAVVERHPITGRRQFGLVDEAWHGEIDAGDPSLITWRQLPAHPGLPAYRMAAVGNDEDGIIVFAGGSNNPYNFNGIGYNGKPSEPLAQVFGFNVETGEWTQYADKDTPTMDHRGLIHARGQYWTFGGMLAGQKVDDAPRSFKVAPPPAALE